MSILRDTPGNRAFMMSFGRFIVVWNHIESVARDIIEFIAGDTPGTMILANHLGNQSLTDAIRVMSDHFPETEGHLSNFANAMDIIRAHRNYYTHGLLGTGHNGDYGTVGIVAALTVKGRVRFDKRLILRTELDALALEAEIFWQYGGKILHILNTYENISARLPHFSSLEKPDTPKTLEKTRRVSLGHKSLPQS